MTTTEHATRRPLRRVESTPGHGTMGSPADAPVAVAAYEAEHPGQLETLCIGEAR